MDVGLAEFFSSVAGIRIACDVAGLACAGGLFVVPLFTAIQADAPKDRRARIVGGVNILNSAFMVLGVLYDRNVAKPDDRRDRAGAPRRARGFEPWRGFLCAEVRCATRGLTAKRQGAKIRIRKAPACNTAAIHSQWTCGTASHSHEIISNV